MGRHATQRHTEKLTVNFCLGGIDDILVVNQF